MAEGSGDLELLLRCGERLDQRVAGGGTLSDLLMARLLRVRNKRGRLVALRPNRAQREYARRATQRNLVLKARQLGITTYIAARFFLQTITRPGTLTVQVAHDQRSAEKIFRIVHRFLENLPEALRQSALETSRANIRQIVFPRLDSEYRVETAADPSAGRGLTIQNLHGSEVARWPRDAAATLASLRAAVVPDGEIVLESTPNGAAGCFYEEWQNAGVTGYTQHFLPWWYEPAYVVRGARVDDLSEEERGLIEAHGLSEEQIAFRRLKRAEFRQRAAEEYAESAAQCFLASTDCLFDVERVLRRLSELGAPTEVRDNGCLEVLLPPQADRRYVIGADPAGGGSEGDFACAQVVELQTGMQCAELRGHFGPQEFAGRVARLAREYNEALVAVERNNHGHAVVAHLQRGENYLHLFEQGGKAGWLTTSVSRPRMLSGLEAALANSPGLFLGRRLLDECRTFVRREDGSAAAASGAHDDCVMAMAIALAAREESAGRGEREAAGAR